VNPHGLAFLGDNNGIAIGLLMLVLILALLAETTSRRRAGRVYWFMRISAHYRAPPTYWRSGSLACISLAGAYWLYSAKKNCTLLASPIVIAVVVPTPPDAFWNHTNTIQTYEEEEAASALGWLDLRQVALALTKARPFLGVGYSRLRPFCAPSLSS
jgi:hypothetical protein